MFEVSRIDYSLEQRELPNGIWSLNARARCPSRKWIEELLRLQTGLERKMQLSLHICGDFLRSIVAGDADALLHRSDWLPSFARCQLNWHAEDQGNILEPIKAAFSRLRPWDPEIIFQFDGVNEQLLQPVMFPKVSALYDTSHGGGVVPDQWPNCIPTVSCGWSGGIGPENVMSVFAEAATRKPENQPAWIDMETKLRTRENRVDTFDLAKCLEVLRQSKQFISVD
jgi:hypothetical protein